MAVSRPSPTVRLARHSDNAIAPRPADYRRANIDRVSWDRWTVYAKSDYDVYPGSAERIQTGWTLLSYPAEDYLLELRLTEWAVRAGLLLANPSLDSLLGFVTEADIAPIVYNTKTSGIVRIRPNDTFFELCLIPKVNFIVTTDGEFDQISR